MNSVESSMEQALQDAGFGISSTPPTQDAQPTQEAAPVEAAPQTQTAPEPSAESAPVQEPVQQQVQEPVQETAPQQEEQSSLNTNDSSVEEFFNALQNEMLSATSGEQFEPETNTAADLDPRIQVIADFVAKTGRSPEDWFRYQALDPSEMDDRTVMRVQMASEYPSLGNDEIDLLIESKYRTDDSVYSDEEVRLANLQLKIDAEKARQSIGALRNEYTTPLTQPSTQAQEDANPFDASWMQDNSRSLSELGEIAFELPGGREFNFGVSKDYRTELAKSNADMTSYFDRYVDENGGWDHDLWNMHRTVTDNLPNILQSIYQQGLSDGQRTIVERAANIDAQSPSSNTVPSQQDSLTQQVLDALGRPQMFLK